MKISATRFFPSGLRVLAMLLLATQAGGLTARANPAGATVNQGTAAITSQGANLTVRTSDRAFINWNSFNIGQGETTTFIQPTSSSLVWNQINDPNPSQILGNLNANGLIVLQNQSGFYVGGQASITAHGLLMTTAPIPMPDLSSSGPWQFNAPPPAARIINYGQINTDKGGSLFLIAHDIENHGSLIAPEGSIGLHAGQQVLVSERPNGLGLSAQVTLPAGSVDNTGKIIADAGTIALHAQVVNQGGLVQANSIREVNGTIELVAEDAVNLGANSVISGQGDAQSVSRGGSVTVKSGNTFSDQVGSSINVSGGAQGGNGGQIEISAPTLGAVHSSLDGHAAAGFIGGALMFDPTTITLDAVAESAYNTQIINGGFAQFAVTADYITLANDWTTPASLSQLTLNANDDLTIGASWNPPGTLSQLNLTAGNNIFLNGYSALTLTTPSAAASGTLNLTAGNNITFGTLDPSFNVLDNGAIYAGNNWNVNLSAGNNGFTPTPLQPKPASGSDGIYLIGSSAIQGGSGNINLTAANEVQVGWGGVGNSVGGSASIYTVGGGSLGVTTKYGDVQTGASTVGYTYATLRLTPAAPFYYSVASGVGGISTAAGGNVNINAGGNVFSYMPNGTTATDAGTGAFGPQPGDVTINAGGSVFGHFVLANGVGTITAGQNLGSVLQNVALSLVKGTWTLNSPGDIYLQEVRNPNGMFNNNRSKTAAVLAGNHLFDYDPNATVNLNAGDGVYLTGSDLPRIATDPVPIIYPPNLSINAGAGGVNLQSSVILFPSLNQNLNITTTSKGNLVSDGSAELIMSDSAKQKWSTSDIGAFGDQDHGGALNELNIVNPLLYPAQITVDGNMENFTLLTSKETWITVNGNMVNSSFSGQNLHGGDVTKINVGGSIIYSSLLSFAPLNAAPLSLDYSTLIPAWASIFYVALAPTVKDSDLVIQPGFTAADTAAAVAHLFAGTSPNPGFVYDSNLGLLGYVGKMSQSVLQALDHQQLTVLVYDSSGNPEVQGNHLVTQPISWVAPATIEALYASSQNAPASGSVQTGLRIGGPGEFDVTAGSISLGNALGIYSCGVFDAEGGFNRYANLAPVMQSGGAKLNVITTGDLDILTSTIAALGGGTVNVHADGTMNLGSQGVFDTTSLAAGILPDPSKKQEGYGIFTTGVGADVTVTAGGDINVQSSRIAAYNGGSITIESTDGNVNAGTGGSAPTQAFFTYIDPITGLGKFFQETVFGSGIVANTLAVPPAGVPSAATPGDITVTTPKGNIVANQGGILQEALNGNVSSGPTVTLKAGSPGFAGNIDLGDTGVIGGTVNVTANGNISGLVISRGDSTIKAAQNFTGTVLSGGTANLAAGGTVSGVVIGIAGVNATGAGGISASLIGNNVSANGGAAASTLAPATATTTSTSAGATANNETQQQVASNNNPDDDPLKKNAKRPVLSRTRGRVTVILPPKS